MVPPVPPPAAGERRLAAIDLPPLAERLLAAGDLAGYTALFARLGELEDRHRRYWAGASLIELGLAACAGGGAGPWAAGSEGRASLLDVLAGAVLEALEREPSEPRLLNDGGVVLRELGSLAEARALLEAALRLDPQLAEAERNLLALEAGRGQPRDPRPPRRPPAGASGGAGHRSGLAARARGLAARAQPVDGLTLSLCMIVRDEEEMLPRCLAAAADAVDEIVIVDTGSRDATVEIARSFGARVIERPWGGSFAEARNVSFDAAQGDWLLYLDADEILVREDAPLLRALMGRTWREAFHLRETNHTGELGAGTAVVHDALRMLRNRPEYRFEGRVHEQIAARLPAYLPERVEASEVRVEHHGYLGSVRSAREKSRRNIELLRLERSERRPSAFLHYNLGAEHAAAGESLAALSELERAWELLDDDGGGASREFLPALASRLVKALRACGRPGDAIARAEQALELLPGFTDLVLEQALACLALGRRERAIELLRRCIEMGEAPRRYASQRGAGTYLPMSCLAEMLCEEGRVAEGIELLERCLREHPDFAGARLTLGIALHASGAEAEAEVQLRAVLERQPQSGRARMALGEMLLAQRRYGEAAEVVGELDSEEAVDRLVLMLETLLRVQDFAAFEALLPLLERTPLPARERRELLAAMYLRRGYAASAAEEWMAVCREQPDARALLGLARVALARGMEREAAEFADAALAHDPENDAAAQLLARIQPQPAAAQTGT